MYMDIAQALKIFDIYGQEVDRKIIKDTYRRLCRKYHPDKNPNGLRYMQDINVAYDYLSSVSDSLLESFSYQSKSTEDPYDEFEPFREVGLEVWTDNDKVYVRGKTFNWRELLKEHHFRWNPDKKYWWRYL